MLNDYCDIAERQSELCLSSDSGLRPRRFLTHGAASKNTGEFKHRRGRTSPYRPAVPGLHTLLNYRNAAFISTSPKQRSEVTNRYCSLCHGGRCWKHSVQNKQLQ